MARRRSGKFIPESDSEFALMARVFAEDIAEDPARFLLSSRDADEISAAVQGFREALSVALPAASRTKLTIMRKDEARAIAERVVRKYANLIRANTQIGATDKMGIGISERPDRLRRRSCPQERPVLSFVGTIGESGSTGRKHVLKFVQEVGCGTRAKPAGAARLELFVELVAPGEPIPRHPGELSGGRLWYLRSFTRNPIEVEFPVPATPMLVVYWGRWADATGEVGPWSNTCEARVEGWTTRSSQKSIAYVRRKMAPQLVNAPRESPELGEGQNEDQYLLPDSSHDVDSTRALPDHTTVTTTIEASLTRATRRVAS